MEILFDQFASGVGYRQFLHVQTIHNLLSPGDIVHTTQDWYVPK